MKYYTINIEEVNENTNKKPVLAMNNGHSAFEVNADNIVLLNEFLQCHLSFQDNWKHVNDLAKTYSDWSDNLLIVYNSVTGNVERFIKKTKLNNSKNIKEISLVNEDFILVTSTVGFGKIPVQVTRFLNDNHQHLIGVVSSGNKNWGINYARAGDVISKQYNVPLLMKFELAGTKSDVERFIKEVKSIGRNS